MKLNFLMVLMTAAVALLASLLLVPRASEQALMLLQTGEIEDSKRILLEHLDAGDLSVAVVGPLLQIHLTEGDVDDAVSLIDRFLRNNPQDAPALNRKGDLLRQANEWQAYADNRRAYFALTGDKEALQDYSALVLLQDRRPERLWALQESDKLGLLEPDEILELSQHLAATGNMEAAYQRLTRLIREAPAKADDLIMAHHARYALALDRADELRRLAEAWLPQAKPVDDAVAYVSYLQQIGQKQLVLELLPYLEKQAASSLLLAELEVSMGAADRAMARLAALPDPSADELRLLFELSLQAGDLDRAADGFRRLAQPDAGNILDLLEAAEQKQRKDILALAKARATPDILKTRPLLAARLAVADGDKAAAARWVDQARHAGDLDFSERLEIANLLMRLERHEEAIAWLRDLAKEPQLPAENLGDLGDLYFRLERFKEGAAVLADIRQRRPRHPLLDAAWARLAAKAGEAEDVRAWIIGSNPSDRALLEDLYYIGGDEQQPALALAAAERLHQLRSDADSVEKLANAYLAANRPRDALALLDAQRTPTPALRDLAFRVRLQAGDARGIGAAVAARLREADITLTQRNELFDILLDPKVTPPAEVAAIARRDLDLPEMETAARDSRLYVLDRIAPAETLPYRRRAAASNAGEATDALIDLLLRLKRRDELLALLPRAIQTAPDRASAEQRLYILLDQKAPDIALPLLRQAAANWGKDWPAAYEDMLAQSGRGDELLALLRGRALNAALPAQQRRDAAFRLLDLRDRANAEAAFQALAANEPPNGEAIQQLLYLWGPRPPQAALNWLEARAKADPSRQRAWLDLLRERGGEDRVLTILQADSAQLLADPARMALLLDILVNRGGQAAANDWLLRASQTGNADAERMQALLDIAESQGLTQARDALAKRLLAVAPQSREAQKRGAEAAFAAGRRSEATRLYAAYLASGPGDWQSLFHYGELLRGQRATAEARQHYEAALDIIERQRRPSDDAQRVRAWLLARLDRREAAFAAMDTLLQQRPKDAELRIDLAGLALELGDGNRAERILNP